MAPDEVGIVQPPPHGLSAVGSACGQPVLLNMPLARKVRASGAMLAGSLYAGTPGQRPTVAKALADSGLSLHVDLFPSLEQGVSLEELDAITSLKVDLLDVHLLNQKSMQHLEAVCHRDVGRVSFPFEDVADPLSVAEYIHAAGKAAWLALAPATSANMCLPLLPAVDGVLVMLIPPGSKNSADLSLLSKIHELVSKGKQVGVDGGIDDANIGDILQAGATYLVAGRSLLGSL